VFPANTACPVVAFNPDFPGESLPDGAVLRIVPRCWLGLRPIIMMAIAAKSRRGRSGIGK
jgi:hypothetical protein